MTLTLTKDNLIELLADKDNRVIALSGKWGTGKSHLWEEVRKESKDKPIEGAFYISLFGLSDLSQIMQRLMLSIAEKNLVGKQLEVAINGVRKVLNSLSAGFSALDEVALFALPKFLKDKVIVVDDIERKHEKLSIEEILGFIDEYTQRHGARFVLILNSDKLDKREEWAMLFDKVVDQEIRLNTSAKEAFDIAIKLSPSPYAKQIRVAVEECGLTNIRIIRRVIKATNRILGERADLSDDLLSRLVPSTVLLAGIHYKGIEDGPEFEFILAQGTPSDVNAPSKKDQIDELESNRRSRWKILLHKLGIRFCDDYELLVIEFLQSGLFNTTAITTIINRLAEENDAMKARSDLYEFVFQLEWNHKLDENQLVAKAEEITLRTNFLDAVNVTALVKAIEEMPGGSELATTILENWIVTFKAKNSPDFNASYRGGQIIHPAIQSEFDAIENNVQTKITVFDACMGIVRNELGRTRHQLALKKATVSDFERTIKSIGIRDLQLFMLNMLHFTLTVEPNSRQSYFGCATDRFAQACKKITQDPASGRLAKVITRVFAEAEASNLLE